MTTDLEQLFLNTDYQTSYGTVRIGQPLPMSLRQWMGQHRCETMVIVGGENPQGKEAEREHNEAMHAQLLNELDARGLVHDESIGRLGTWSERHVVVLGITVEEGLALAASFDQAAIVFCSINSITELVWTSND